VLPEPPLISKTGGLVLLVFALAGAVAMAAAFRPRAPSPFSVGSGYGTGHGTDSIMMGGSPRAGVAD